MGQAQIQFGTQGFPQGVGGAVPASAAMSGETLPNGGYVGMQQQQQQQQQAAPVSLDPGQSPYSVQQGQWSMNQVTHGNYSSQES